MSSSIRGLLTTKRSSKKYLQKQVLQSWNWCNFQKPMLVYFDSFNTVQIGHACLQIIFQYGRVYLHFIYPDIYVCYIRILFIRILHCTKDEVSINDFFSKCDQIRSFLRIWSYLLKNSLMKNFIFCEVLFIRLLFFIWILLIGTLFICIFFICILFICIYFICLVFICILFIRVLFICKLFFPILLILILFIRILFIRILFIRQIRILLHFIHAISKKAE